MKVSSRSDPPRRRDGVLCRVGRLVFGGGEGWLGRTPLSAEAVERPSVMAARAFFRRPSAVVALAVLILLFLFVFLGPIFLPMDLTYTAPLQANMAPNFSLCSMPAGLRDDIRSVSGFADFTVGVSGAGDLYLWGNPADPVSGVDLRDCPAGIREGNVAHAAAGADHILAVTTDGHLLTWGNPDSLGDTSEGGYIPLPDDLRSGIDPAEVRQLLGGYRCSALVTTDGRAYLWGNGKAMLNLAEFAADPALHTGIRKLAVSNYYTLALREDGTVTGGRALSLFGQSAMSSRDGAVTNLAAYLDGRTVVDIDASEGCYALVLSDGSVTVFGAATYGERDLPADMGKERIIAISAGSRHFVALAESGRVFAWGQSEGGACDVAGETAARIFTGSRQSYLADEAGRLTAADGFRGHLLGTDGHGRDILTRLAHGGRMTMTVGGVAVIVATLIAVAVGCLSGYFGGRVDLFLMRLTEIFSSIPFLPFAMMLSYVIRTVAIGENTRILIIMIMLGLLSWPALARLVRAQVLAEREREFVLAARAMGVRERTVAMRHVLPNVLSVILVSVTLDFAACMLTESGLSYLGFGVQQPRPTWGNMLGGANNSLVIQNYPWQWLPPALALSVATICINIIGDSLRDALDPRSSSER